MCDLCARNYTDFNCHFFCECLKLTKCREKFWNFISNDYSIELEVELNRLSDYDFVSALLGGNIRFFKDSPQEHLIFLKSSAYIWHSYLNSD